jgi:hypothetical protein
VGKNSLPEIGTGFALSNALAIGMWPGTTSAAIARFKENPEVAMISVKTHSILDFLAASVLLIIPAFTGMLPNASASIVFFGTGAILFCYSLLTDYRFALWRVIPMGAHLFLDNLLGLGLMLAPWVFGYRATLNPSQETLHYLMAIGIFAIAAFTGPAPEANPEADFDYSVDEPPYENRRAG